MFDALKGMAGLGGLMKDLPRIRQRLDRARSELADMTVEANAGGGAVTAVADGRMRIRSVKVDPAMLSTLVDVADGNAQRMAEDLITSAVNAALERAQQMISDHLKEAAAELGIPLPPGGIPGLL
ncbi:MAG: YbaB/EbfC family nucleoid-associated protein [Planctomycetota bacterium]|mgnify:CR=1 FL=1|jgi:nucleoid-associated protein EbfC|nr:YbaB/EbfC family nucleoid-associated protein [Planctomycetota bacterium]MDA1027363.1 YbaB/EbfC family nucleoid-associated protein [Planctomycetota bacterium]